MEAFVRDLRHGFRVFRRHPGTTLVIILSIALGVSVNTTVFSWIDSILLDPLPAVPGSRELVTFATRTQSGEYLSSSYPDYKDYAQQSHSLQGITAFRLRPLSLERESQVQRIWGMLVTGNYFDVLDLQPAQGRFFLPEDRMDVPAAQPVAVVSHAFWKSQLNGDPRVVGQKVTLNGQTFTIIGVSPEGFHGSIVGLSADVFVPLLMQDRLLGGPAGWTDNRRFRNLLGMGRLAPGITLPEARAEMAILSQRLSQTHADSNAGVAAALLPLAETPYGAQSQLGDLLKLLQFVGGVILLIVCANMTNLLIVRASEREKEISLRFALGAGRGRILRQLITESLLLSLAAALLALSFTSWMTGLLPRLMPASAMPVSLQARLSPSVLLLTALLSVGAGLASALLPALRSLKVGLGAALKDGGQRTSASRGKQRLRAMLVVSEVALALVALVGAGLFVKSFHNISQVDPGFDDRPIVLVGLASAAPGREQGPTEATYRRIKEQVKSLASVRGVTYAGFVPLGPGGGSWEDLEVEGYVPATGENMKVYRNFVDDDYFQVLQIPLVSGRAFGEQDRADAAPVAIVNETFVKRFFAGRNPVGRRLRGWGKSLTIVGTVKDSKYATLSEAPRPYLYVPFRQFAGSDTEAVVHVAVDADPTHMVSSLRREIGSINPLLYISYARTMTDFIGASSYRHKVSATLLSLLGTVALVLAALGIFGVISHTAAQRTQEIGVRMAVGASGANILKLVISQGVRLTVIGLLIGAAAAAGLSRMLAALLFRVGTVDPIAFAGAALLLLSIAVLASAIPAFRASRVDPVKALRWM